MTPNNTPLSKATPMGGLSHANKKHMSEYSIIAEDVKKYRKGMNPKKAYAAVLKMTQQTNYRVLRHNNSLLLIDNHKNGTADSIIFSCDNSHDLVDSLKHFNLGLKAAGIHQLEITSDNKDIEPALKKAKLQYSATPTQTGVHVTVEIK
jgi:hypothetical protein